MALPITSKAVVFVDGFNLYHSMVDGVGLADCRWLDLWALSARFVPPKHLSRVLYFTAYADWSPGKVQRHRRYVRALRTKGVEVVRGQFKRKTLTCRRCHQLYGTHEEKRTDVNIAVYMMELAHLKEYDTAVLMTGDTDIVPAVEAVKRLYGKRVMLVRPPGQRVGELAQACTEHRGIYPKHLKRSQLEDPVVLPDGTQLSCPATWR